MLGDRLDPPAGEDGFRFIGVVDDEGLARRDGALGFTECDVEASGTPGWGRGCRVVEWSECGGDDFAVGAELDEDGERRHPLARARGSPGRLA